MSEWLTSTQALVLIGQASGDVDLPTFEGALAAARTVVEGKRSDLKDGSIFTPNDAIKLGTAMLANRWYERRSSPLGAAQFSEFGAGTILRYDPDIGRLLGIGTEGSFNFGAAGYVAPVEDVV